MNNIDYFNNIIIKNPDNKYIVDEFIRYYMFIYSNYTKSEKSSKENYYKLIVIKKTIEIISKFKDKIITGSQLASIKGIGPKTIDRIDEIIKNKFLSEIPIKNTQIQVIKKLSEIYGIGPVKASEFYENYNIKSIKDLIKADEKHLIKLTNQMKLGIKYSDSLIQKIPRILIVRLDIFINKLLYGIDHDFISVICGSYRRGKDFSSDVDILITHKKLTDKKKTGSYLKTVIDCLKKYFIIDSLTSSYNTHFQGFASFKNIPDIPKSYDKQQFDIDKNVIRLDIILIPEQFFYTGLMHFTGSGDFNQKMRLHANSLGLKLSEYGLSKIDFNGKEQFIEINSEKDIFDALLLKYIEPEKR